MSVPVLGIGTFRLTGDVVKQSVKMALQAGYRAIDTAQIYNNESEVGEAIRESGIAREELYITTKIWVENLGKDRLIDSLKESLTKLGTDYIDLTLIHWYPHRYSITLEETLIALMEAKRLGLTHEIGVSNFTVALMEQAAAIIKAENIATNQIELSPYLQNEKVVQAAKRLGIHITSYMTLAYGKALSDETICQIATKHQATPAQIILAWAMQLGYSVIPSSTKRENLASNLLAQKIRLSEAEMQQIRLLDRNERLTDPEGLAPEWD